MSSLFQLSSYWNIVSEVDLRPLAIEASQEVRLVIVSSTQEKAALLADQLRRDPARPDMQSDAPVRLLSVNEGDQAVPAELIILLLDGFQSDYEREKELARKWANAGQRVLVFVEIPQKPAGEQEVLPKLPWIPRYVLYGPLDDPIFLHQKLVSLVIRILPNKLIPLGRNYPFFRVPIAHYLINDTSQSNAAYSLATGLAQIVPILNIPLVITDMIILTKNQAFLVYKLGLVFGFTSDWRSYAAEFGSVIGAGFLWRQLARSLVGLLPVIGIMPKVAISYAGTKVVGTAILQWYLTGRHISAPQLKATYQRALSQGKSLARDGLSKRRREKLPEPQKKPRALLPRRVKPTCPQCMRVNNKQASFCQYCGAPLHADETGSQGQSTTPAA